MWTVHVTRRGDGRDAYMVLVGRPQGKPRRRREDNIKMILVK